MNRSEIRRRSRLSAAGGRERTSILRFLSGARQSLLQHNESLTGIKDGKVILPAWLGTCTLPQRCSLFSRGLPSTFTLGAVNQQQGERRPKAGEFFKEERAEGSCSSQPLSGVTDLAGGPLVLGLGLRCVRATSGTHENVYCLLAWRKSQQEAVGCSEELAECLRFCSHRSCWIILSIR